MARYHFARRDRASGPPSASVPQEDEFVPPSTAPTVAPDLLARCAGRYNFGPNALMTVTASDGQLWTTLSKFGFFDLRKAEKRPLVPLSGNEFYIAGRYATRPSFLSDSSGRVTGAVINPGPLQQAGIRDAD